MSRLSGTCFFLLFLTVLQGQNTNLFQVPDSLKSVDSVSVSYWNDEEKGSTLDTIPDILAHHYRVNLKKMWGGVDLGNNGSEVRPNKFAFDTRPGLRMGYGAFDVYRWTFENLPFYNTAEAHTRLFASQGNSFANSTRSAQDNSHFEGEFSKGFANNVRASVFYRKISEDGLYSRDESNHTQFAARITQESNEGRLFIAGAFVRNVFNRQEYGGLENLSYFSQESFDVRSTIPVNQTDAGLRDEENNFNFGIKYQLASTGGSSGLFVVNLMEYTHRQYKYGDQQAGQLDSIYDVWLDHPEKLRHAWDQRSFTNDLSLKWTSRLFPKIRAGVIFSQNTIDDEASSYDQTFVTLNGDVDFKLRDIIDIELGAQLELVEEVGDFNLEGALSATWPDVGELSGQLSFGQQSPARIYEKLTFNLSTSYQSEGPPTQYFIVGGKLKIPRLGLSLSADQYILNQYVYRSYPELLPTESDISTVTVLTGESKLKWGPLQMFNGILYHATNDDVFIFPDWSSRHILAFEGKIFRNNMWVRTGIEARLFYQEDLPVFIPVTGEFLPSDINYDQVTYSVDPFILVKIDRFTAFVKGERLESLWLDQPFLQAEGYPRYDWMFRFGINWRYVN